MSERKLDSNQDGNWNCNVCEDTGYYGNNGPGTSGNAEYVECECQSTMSDKTAGEIVDNVADKLGIYGACQSDKGKGCSKDTCNCRSGFVTVLQSEIESLMDSQLQELRESVEGLRSSSYTGDGQVYRQDVIKLIDKLNT